MQLVPNSDTLFKYDKTFDTCTTIERLEECLFYSSKTTKQQDKSHPISHLGYPVNVGFQHLILIYLLFYLQMTILFIKSLIPANGF